MTNRHLHIISFNVPYPPNYGGVIDVFYKIRSLQKAGLKIHLHCFQYGREKAQKLENYCEEVHYYSRKFRLKHFFSIRPFIVSTRANPELLNNLKRDNYPILFEGIHTTCFINHPFLAARQKLVRMHNIEWQYYTHLSSLEQTWYKKLFFKIEAKRLMKYELGLATPENVIAISRGDYEYYHDLFPNNTTLITAFHENNEVLSLTGMGSFVLYHGDLSVKDNEVAALYLIEEVFRHTDIPFIIAGLDPGQKLIRAVARHKNIKLKANLGFREMQQLIAEAQVNVLYSSQSAGMKLKLLNALYRGRHCVVNDKMVEKSGLEGLCEIKNTGPEMLKDITQLMTTPFDHKEKQRRITLLEGSFSNENNAAKLIALLGNN